MGGASEEIKKKKKGREEFALLSSPTRETAEDVASPLFSFPRNWLAHSPSRPARLCQNVEIWRHCTKGGRENERARGFYGVGRGKKKQSKKKRGASRSRESKALRSSTLDLEKKNQQTFFPLLLLLLLLSSLRASLPFNSTQTPPHQNKNKNQFRSPPRPWSTWESPGASWDTRSAARSSANRTNSSGRRSSTPSRPG